MNILQKTRTAFIAIFALAAAFSTSAAPDLGSLPHDFQSPPPGARPWVYWFWLNGNITSNGITADLEAMKRAGIGGVLIMEVDQGAPVGPQDFMSASWRKMFTHVVSEAGRLGLEVNMNDDAGWNGSGGPWIKPEQSMQKVVSTETNVAGPKRFEGTLAKAPAVAAYYRDISVLAFPTPGSFRIKDIKSKACYQSSYVAPPLIRTNVPSEMIIPQDQVLDISTKMDASGRLVWDAPPGNWTIMRFGHTSTGMENAPAPATGRGLECDKLSKEGSEANFAGMMERLIADVGAGAGRTLVATHIDSWENGAQNWTARMREEFKRRRGYELQPFLPVMTGRVVGSLEISERFLLDLRQTISDLVVENYAGHMRALARRHGLRLSIEAYGGPCEDLPYAGRADEPMCEFWIGGGAFNTVKGMASAAHVYGKPILGAEAFTADNNEKWQEFPGSIKALGDRAFCEGVSRFVFHRYALQPWAQDYRPGMTMGPWGLHYERSQTWWEWSAPWHEYLARCQFLLRQGSFVADLCYLQPETAPQDFRAHNLRGYDYDECPAEVVLTRMSVRDGRIVLPDGMSYRALVLADTGTMTPRLLRKIGELIRRGATVIGARPQKSPSLSGYPECDAEVKQVAAQIWGDCDGTTKTENRLGEGRVVCGIPPEKVLATSGVDEDFSSGALLRYIHRAMPEADIYFVANPRPHSVESVCTFRVTGRQPELWWPDSGKLESVASWKGAARTTTLPLRLEPAGSVFVVFPRKTAAVDPIVDVLRDGESLLPKTSDKAPKIVIKTARYGVLDDPARTRDVRARLQRLIDAGDNTFRVARMAEGDDPAYLVVKTLTVEYTADGKALTANGTDPETLSLVADAAAPERIVALRSIPRGVVLEAFKPGHFDVRTVSGGTRRIEVPSLPQPIAVGGPWEVHFAPGGGAPETTTFESLTDWAKAADPGVRFYSGTGIYTKTIDLPAAMTQPGRRLYLDLGHVAVMAQVRVNNRELGTLWKPPYRVDITDAAKPGQNTLTIRVVNQWINRMLGDEQLAEDSERNPDGTLKRWPAWVREGKPSPAGRYTFTTWRLWKKGAPLRESGLLGPVQIVSSESVEIGLPQ